MSTYEYGQINVRLDKVKFDKLKQLCRADNRSMASYVRLIVEDFLNGKYLPRNRKIAVNYENQTE